MRRTVIALTLLVACTPPVAEKVKLPPGIPEEVEQLVVVQRTQRSEAWLTLYARGDGWLPIVGPVSAVVGRNGVAAPAAKHEGDGMTPSGLFALGPAFGYAPKASTAMPYREATADDVWIDDPTAPDYNTWTRASVTSAKSFERMRRADALYEEGLVIAYNTAPITPGAGSAIFVHVWEGPASATSGCVAVAKETLDQLFAQLHPARKPHILIVP